MYYIGFDIGGTKCAVSLGEVVDGNITLLGREEVPTTTPEETLDKLAPTLARFQADKKIAGAGISCGGPLDTKNGVILTPPNLPKWHNFAIVPYIKNRFGLDAVLENDANACAVAEWRFGAGKGAENMVFCTFGTGLGAGLILNGKLYGGANGNAGEIGHISLAKSGPVGYGKAGSFEGFCSGGGITRLAVDMAKKEKVIPDCIVKMGGLDSVTTKKLSEYAFAGDAFAKKVFAKSGRMLGKGLSIVIDILNPEKIVLGGVFMRSGALLIPAMEKEIKKHALENCALACEIVAAQLSENVGDIAAISIAVLES
jgi:glucokinase